MAYDDPRVSQQAAAPVSYEPLNPRVSFSTSYATSPASHQTLDSQDYQSRSDLHMQNNGNISDSSQFREARRPINEAVTSAFETSNVSAATALSPEILNQITSQITASVIQQLKASNLPVPSVPEPAVQAPIDNSSAKGSPPINRATVYTPPSPYRASDEPTRAQGSPLLQPRPNQLAQANEKRPMSPSSQGSHVDDSDVREERLPRPQELRRASTGGDTTIMEKVWGKLFDNGQPTARLGQFLRGIAVHLIEDYEPKHSLVITPTKMQRYYQETKLDNEIYPWQMVFDDRTSSISRMFREIEAQHHLVQDKLSERPDIPGLTPQGFETWATLLIRAHPNEEFDRLVKTALDMPISNPDDRKERFPKEISRRLFPKETEPAVAMKLQKAMSTHCNVPMPSRNSNAAGPAFRQPLTSSRPDGSAQPSMSQSAVQQTTEKQDHIITPVSSRGSPPATYSNIERQRQPYSNAPSEADIEEDGDDVPTPQPIERERKPYVAQPGGGKSYDNDENAYATEYKTSIGDVKLSRTMSNTGTRKSDFPKSRPAPIAIHQASGSAPMDIPESRPNRSSTAYHRDYPSSGGRNRSPSMSKDSGFARRSDTSTTFGSMPSVGSDDVADESRRRRDYEVQRERLANDRYDAARMSAYDPRDRERESRPRGQSISAFDNGKAPHATEEEYYRNAGSYKPSARDGYPPYPSAQFPPSSYREAR